MHCNVYVACSAVVQEAIWLRRFLQRLGATAHAEDIVLLYSDSTSALTYAKDLKYHGKPNTLSFGTTTFEIWFHKGKWSYSIYILVAWWLILWPSLLLEICSSLILRVWDSVGYDMLRYFVFVSTLLLLFYDMRIHFISFIFMWNIVDSTSLKYVTRQESTLSHEWFTLTLR